ncbi:RNA polymerase sigma factor [Aquimarina sp. W85]|uniref:RNA polymerase sigma factor n=1 Tax=Aquimarina rhodophyticola TaxID=3342246 RepID=UPI003671616C
MNKDEHITKLLLNGSDKDFAFKTLIEHYGKPLYWHIRNMVKDHDDANDVLQNVFIKVYRHVDNFKGDSKLFSWIYRIATNESITFLNNKAKKNNISNAELYQKLTSNLEADIYFEGDEIQLKLQKAIASLPQRQQQVFNMKYFEDLTYKEIAEILELTEGSLKATYHLASKKIETYLKNY